MKNSKRILALLLSLVLAFSLCATAWAEGEYTDGTENTEASADAGTDGEEAAAEETTETVSIATTEDFIAFANNCRTDSWSKNKVILLQADISLSGTGFEPIASFSGTFKGNGHTISGLNLAGHISSAGLFAQVEQGAQILNLNVTGTIDMASSCETVGGIAGRNKGVIESCSFSGSVEGNTCVGGICGTNELAGKIRSCLSSGSVTGTTETGGIAGENNGSVSGCTNTAYVNTTSADSSIALSDVNLDFSLDTDQLTSGNNVISMVKDTGGITGYNAGALINCTNNSIVGYQHVGYNVGGIAGRSCGFVESCSNTGSVYGRKDVGGIVGQMEPYIVTNISESTLATLRQELQELSDLVNQAANDAQGGAGGVSSMLDGMAGSVADAINQASDVSFNITADGAADGSISTDGQTEISGSVDGTDISSDITDAAEDIAQDIQDVVTGDTGDWSIPDDGSGADASVPDSTESTDGSYDGSGSTDGTDGSFDVSGGADDGGYSVDISGDDGSASIGIDSDGTISANINGSTVICATPDLSGLTGAINSIGSQLSALNGSISGAVGAVADDVRKINDKFTEMSNTLFDAIFTMNTTVSDIVEDTSDLDIDLVTLGKVFRCRNTGTVQGDIDTGGITGTMALDSSDDQEDDTMENLSAATQNEYEVKAIIQNCVNNGTVEGKRSYVGGICGRMALGLITSAKNYGNVSSESGDYVGGIAGIASSTVRNCFADCTLSGGQYVGGITGSGVTQSLTGETSTITGCYSMVEILACTQYEGAVSGASAGSYLSNYFVSDTLQGIDGLNYSGKAEPITYAQLLQVENLPEEMKKLTLSFVADGKVLKSIDFEYGDSFGSDVYPEIPAKDGYYGVWDKTELNNLHFNTVVSVVYTEYTTALPSEVTRDSDRPVFIALGSFDSDQKLVARSETQSVDAFAPLSNGIEEAARHYLATISGHGFTDTAINRSVEEQWIVTIPDDGQATHTVRYLSPEESTENIDLYVKQDNGWKRLDCTSFGTYLEFTLEGNNAEIAVVQVLPIVWIWLAIFGAILLLVLMVVLLIRHTRRIHRKIEERKAMRAAAESGNKEAAEKIRAEEEAETVIGKNGKKRKKRHFRVWLIPLIIFFVLLIAVCGIIWHYVDALGDSLVPYTMLRELSQRSDLTMQLQLDADIGGEETSLEATLTNTSTDSKKVTAVTADDITFYYADGAVILENGRAFRLEESFPDYSTLLATMVPLLRDADITMQSGGENTWVVTLNDNGVQTLLSAVLPTIGATVADTEQAQLTLKASDVSLTEIDLDLAGHLSDENATAFTMHATLNNFGSGTVTLPDAVVTTVNNGLTGSEPVITEDVLKLATAWAELNGREITAADIALKVNAGPIVLDDTLKFAAKNAENGQRIWHITQNLLDIYGSDTGVVTADGTPISDDEAELAGVETLLDTAYTICLEGNLTASTDGDTTVYTANLSGSELTKLAEEAVPQLASQNVTLSYGTLTLTLKNGVIDSLVLNCTGTVRVVLVDADVSITDTVTFTDGSNSDFTIPDAVLTALTPEE